ncbi:MULTISPECIES: hypothetical protein [Nocardioides]|uniref:Uncharacterized protein n=1 Tax=Nocardioides vastitatis TaxID=2568655 RepID=A0ABW0ZG59_9ACTN|nr:hypothetical protein [Nocardioides sp.]THJ04266.1 hypothetical protein E7Z54_08565 [Nocardioides sp.]
MLITEVAATDWCTHPPDVDVPRRSDRDFMPLPDATYGFTPRTAARGFGRAPTQLVQPVLPSSTLAWHLDRSLTRRTRSSGGLWETPVGPETAQEPLRRILVATWGDLA